MKSTFKLVLVMLLVCLVSIYLTPLVYSFLPMFKFEKIFNRLIMIFTISAAFIFVLKNQRKSGRPWSEFWKDLGFDFSAPWKKLLIYGFLSGSLAVAFIVAWETAFGPRYLRSPISIQDIIERFFKGATSGILVGIIEEFFFRGFVFNFLRKRIPVVLAVALASAFYSMTHFFDNGQIFIPQRPSASDGFRLLVGYLEPFKNHLPEIFPQFFGLFVFGIVLCVAFLRSNSLFLSIGIHAGAVFSIKFQHSFIRKPLEDLHYSIFGNSVDYDGPFEWFILALLGLVLWYVILPRLTKNPPPSGPTAR